MMSTAERPMVVIITGPTAVGKTAASIEIAQKMRGEIISADSMQIYRLMDIGTAKPSEEERKGIPHHIMDQLDPAERFTVADFQQTAFQIIGKIHQRGNLPIVTGGTGLYLHSLLYQMNFTDVEIDQQLRARLEEEAAELGGQAMHQRLETLDPEAAERIHPHNVKKIIRALEVRLNAEQGVQDFSKDLVINADYDFRVFVFHEDRDSLYNRINRRVDLMLEIGLESEVRRLLALGYDEKLPAMQGVGYKEMIRYIKGEIGYEESVDTIKRNSRRYAKRQLTWFKKLPHAHWLFVDRDKPRDQEINRLISLILKNLSGTNPSTE